MNLFSQRKKMQFTKTEQQKSHKKAKICYICREKVFKKDADDEKYFKARYHCSYTGKYRGASQSICKVYVKKFQ